MEKSEAVVYPAMLLSYFDPHMLSCAQSSQLYPHSRPQAPVH